MNTKEYMADFAVKWAKDDTHGYTNSYPNNQWWKDRLNNDCGSFMSLCLHEALLQIGIDTGYNYFEPTGSRIPWNEAFLTRYCNRYDYQSERNQVGDILTSNGHTEMIVSVDPDYLCGARNDYDGKSGDSSSKEVAVSRLYTASGGWNFIYRLKDEYVKEIGVSGTIPEKESPKDQKVTYQTNQIALAVVEDIVLKKGSPYKELVKVVQNYLSYYGWYKGQIDGDWGDMTDSAVYFWQKANPRVGDADRVIGKMCWKEIMKY